MKSAAQFHEAYRQQAHQEALDRMRNVAERGQRMMNPTFRGLPANSSGAQLHLFNSHRDESHIPLPTPISAAHPLGSMVRGGALSTPEGQAYAKKILARRARDYAAIQNADATLPIESLPTFYESDQVLQQFNLNQFLSSIGDIIQLGEFRGETLQALQRALGSLMALLPTLRTESVVEIYQYIQSVMEQVERLLAAKEDLGPQADRILQSIQRSLQQAQKVVQVFTRDNLSDKNKRKLLNDLLKDFKLPKLSVVNAASIAPPPTPQMQAPEPVTEPYGGLVSPSALLPPLPAFSTKPQARLSMGSPLSIRPSYPQNTTTTTENPASMSRMQDTTGLPLNLTSLQSPPLNVPAIQRGNILPTVNDDDEWEDLETSFGESADAPPDRSAAFQVNYPGAMDLLNRINSTLQSSLSEHEKSLELASRALTLSDSIGVYKKDKTTLLPPDAIIENVRSFVKNEYGIKPHFTKKGFSIEDMGMKGLLQPMSPLKTPKRK